MPNRAATGMRSMRSYHTVHNWASIRARGSCCISGLRLSMGTHSAATYYGAYGPPGRSHFTVLSPDCDHAGLTAALPGALRSVTGATTGCHTGYHMRVRNVLTCTTALRSGPHRALALDPPKIGSFEVAVILRMHTDPFHPRSLRGAAQRDICTLGNVLTCTVHCG